MYVAIFFNSIKLFLTACPEISHCLENQCTSLGTNRCVKCDGEVRPDKYWAAYTRKPSASKLCQSMYFKLNKNINGKQLYYIKIKIRTEF